MLIDRRDVSFKTTDGLVLRGWIYPTERLSPCIIMTPGLGGIRHHHLVDFAACFHEKGYSVLLYDNRNWGDSDGSPRQQSNPFQQLTDYWDAYNYVCTMPFVDRSKVVYWGSSFSGGNVIYAAAIDKRIKAAIVQCSSVSGELRAQAFNKDILGLLDDRSMIASDGGHPRVPLITSDRSSAVESNERVMFPGLDSYDSFVEMEGLGPWENFLTSQTQLYMALAEPQAVIHRISPTPLLMIVPQNDTVVKTEAQIAAFEKAKDPKEMVLIKDAGHFDIYSGQAFEENISAQLSFLKRVLD